MTKYICRNTTYEIDFYESVNRTTNRMMDIATDYLINRGYSKLNDTEPISMQHSIINQKLFTHFDHHGDIMIKVGVFWEAVMDLDKHYRLVMKVKIYGNANTLDCEDENQCNDTIEILDKEIRDISDRIANEYALNDIDVEDAGTESFITDNHDDTWSHEKNNAMVMYYNN